MNHSHSDELTVRISYYNLVLYEEDLNEGIDIEVEITSEKRELTIRIKDNNANNEKISTKTISSVIKIENTIKITNDLITMIHANCPAKKCMYMKITKPYHTIFCTNGILVEIISNNIFDYIHTS